MKRLNLRGSIVESKIIKFTSRLAVFLVIGLMATRVFSSETIAAEESVDDTEYVSSYAKFDRYESYNRFMFRINDSADEYLLRPVAKFYRYITPSLVDEGVTNVFNNLEDVETFVNSLLQAKFHNAIVSLNRVIYNTVFGLGGIFDVATSFGLTAHEEDFGQTLGYWGYEESVYLVLPLLGPSTFRDFTGRIVDTFSDPINYVDEIHQDTQYLMTGLDLLDQRADLLAAENLLFGDDRYAFIRSAYYQNRDFMINDGEVDDPFSDDDYDYDDF
jgi:phospholipid-binding lipoprotein MlaA